VERAYCLVVKRDGGGRRTGYGLSLGVLDHGRLHRVRRAGLPAFPAIMLCVVAVEPFGWLVATLGPTPAQRQRRRPDDCGYARPETLKMPACFPHNGTTTVLCRSAELSARSFGYD